MFAVKKLVEEYGEERAEKIMAAEGGVNTLVFYETDGEAYLKSIDADFCKTPFCGAYTVRNFTRNADYDAGVYTFQSVGSLAICAGVESGKTLLDACAAPGGKSVNLSYRFDSVTACELSKKSSTPYCATCPVRGSAWRLKIPISNSIKTKKIWKSSKHCSFLYCKTAQNT